MDNTSLTKGSCPPLGRTHLQRRCPPFDLHARSAGDRHHHLPRSDEHLSLGPELSAEFPPELALEKAIPRSVAIDHAPMGG